MEIKVKNAILSFKKTIDIPLTWEQNKAIQITTGAETTYQNRALSCVVDLSKVATISIDGNSSFVLTFFAKDGTYLGYNTLVKSYPYTPATYTNTSDETTNVIGNENIRIGVNTSAYDYTTVKIVAK